MSQHSYIPAIEKPTSKLVEVLYVVGTVVVFASIGVILAWRG